MNQGDLSPEDDQAFFKWLMNNGYFPCNGWDRFIVDKTGDGEPAYLKFFEILNKYLFERRPSWLVTFNMEPQPSPLGERKLKDIRNVVHIETTMQYNLYELIEKISVRTGMYIGEPKLENVMSFLAGYRFAMDSIGAIDTSEPSFGGFHNWVAAKYGFYESTSGWANMILTVELSLNPTGKKEADWAQKVTEMQHRNSVETFFKLVSEFKNA